MTIPQDLLEWDPLSEFSADPGLADEMKRQGIRNILRSYTGFFDLFSELIQNSLDAVDMRALIEGANYQPKIWILIDIKNQSVSVADNGIGLSEDQLKLFLQPSVSFKKTGTTRGEKGVGATYLAYGFNYMQIATKVPGFEYVGNLENGRNWVEDRRSAIIKPRIRPGIADHAAFHEIDRGTSFTVKLTGENIRPKDLAWIMATSADQWNVLLRIKTPLGGIYLSDKAKSIPVCDLTVVDSNGLVTQKTIQNCEYFYPHKIGGKPVALKDLTRHQDRLTRANRPVIWPPEFSRLTAIYDTFSTDEILNGAISVRLTERQLELMAEHKPDVYTFFAYSTQVWDEFNDNKVHLRQKYRILKGGLQLATQRMPQGDLLTIPLTQSTGYQNTTHVIVHFYDAEPDLGRKGFQPELVELASVLSVASVNTFKRWHERLKKDVGEPQLFANSEKHRWVALQEQHELKYPLTISGSGLFAPEEVVPITSKPLLEQDVIALFNQLLAAGVIRGFRVLATSEHQRYDSIVRIHIERDPKFEYDPRLNPLGVPGENIRADTTSPLVLEYKYRLDTIVDDFGKEIKFENNVDLVVAWEMGEKWKERYQVNPLLHNSHLQDRNLHGITHQFVNVLTGAHVFYAIILDELIRYLQDPDGIQDELEAKYMID